MTAAIPWSWPLIALLAAAYVLVALHAGLSMRRYGRRWWLWFVLSVLLTVIPAVVCSYVEYFRQVRRQREALHPPAGGVGRCRHCGAVLTGEPGRSAAATVPTGGAPGQPKCPRCGMPAEEDNVA